MSSPSRRSVLLATTSATTLASTGLAGCLSTAGVGRDAKGEHTPGPNVTSWDETPDCVTVEERDEMDEHYDSTIQVDHTTSTLDGGYAPIHFGDLSDAERDLLDVVTTEGGYSTCDIDDVFGRFLERVREHLQRQSDTMAYLERDGVYYGLRVEITDQGISY